LVGITAFLFLEAVCGSR